MRVFLYSLIGIPLLTLDGILLYTLPARFISRLTLIHMVVIVGGVVAYFLFHFFIRKPERLYLWGHELTHLVVAKIFFKKVHGFHIATRTGGKVIIDSTNVAIYLAPYAIPFYSLLAVAVALMFRSEFVYLREIYLAFAAFLFTMHMFFSVEGFFESQPDLQRSGRIFSGGVILLCLLLWMPVLWAPVTKSGLKGIFSFYGEWFNSAFYALRWLLLYSWR